jgi:signal transduction histidine kinase
MVAGLAALLAAAEGLPAMLVAGLAGLAGLTGGTAVARFGYQRDGTDHRNAEHAVTEPAVAEPAVAEHAVAEPAVAEHAVAEPAVAEKDLAEKAVAERVAALDRANGQLMETNRGLEHAAAFKIDLMALVSHEMSQPLSSAASLAELLADSWEQLPEETRLDLTLKIHRNTRRLVAMVNDMMLLFYLDSGTVTARRTPVPVAEVVDLAAAALPAGAEIRTEIDPATDALVERGHLEQIIGNLLGNAVAYGAPPIEVTARLDVEGVLIAVTDHGLGIPEEIRPRLFDRAVRPKATGTGAGQGRGLGLFIARHLTEVNGGRIWYEQAEPHGARLVVRLQSTAAE